MISICQSHTKLPTLDDPKEAREVAREILNAVPFAVPGLMWDFSYPHNACCAVGAYAQSLVRIALCELLSETS